jgi:hypothetical protein
MKTLESILHLYLGCKAEIKSPGSNIKYVETLNGAMVDVYRGTSDVYEYIKPILRPLDSMTQREAIELCKMQIKGFRDDEDVVRIIQMKPVVKFIIHHKDEIADLPYLVRHLIVRNLNIDSYLTNQLTYLLSKSFDLFGLIDSGLALNATKLEGYASKI